MSKKFTLIIEGGSAEELKAAGQEVLASLGGGTVTSVSPKNGDSAPAAESPAPGKAGKDAKPAKKAKPAPEPEEDEDADDAEEEEVDADEDDAEEEEVDADEDGEEDADDDADEEEDADDAEEEEDADDEAKPTLVEVTKALKAIGKDGKAGLKKVRQILKAAGVPSASVSDLKPAQFAKVLKLCKKA